ncbi:MAG: hormogonium polysaccharide biosynthesis glycosyltransferase HpsE, partial [Cyanobacteriota bacterium]
HALRIARLGAKVRWLMPLYFLSDGLKLVQYYLKHRGDFDDIVKACDLQEKMGRFLSPFYV